MVFGIIKAPATPLQVVLAFNMIPVVKKISAINPRALAPPIYWITIPLQAYLATTKPLITHLQALQKRLKPISRVFGIMATAHTNCQPQFHQGPMAALGLQLLQQSPEIT